MGSYVRIALILIERFVLAEKNAAPKINVDCGIGLLSTTSQGKDSVSYSHSLASLVRVDDI